MKFSIPSETFLSLVSTVAPVVPAKPTLPILGNLLIAATGTELRVTGTNMDQTISVTGSANVTEAGAITVNAKRLMSLLREMPKSELSVSVAKDKFTLSYPNGKAEVMGIPDTDYPAINGLGDDFESTAVNMTSEAFKHLADTGGFCVASDRTRLALTGAFLEIADGMASVVSTDGHRLARAIIGLDTDTETASAILPFDGLTNAVKLCGQMNLLSIRFGKGAVRFTLEDAVLLTKTVEGPYPNFKQVIPTEHKCLFVTSADEFAKSVRRVDVLSNSMTRKVELLFKDDAATLCAENADIGGESKETVEGTYAAEELRIGLNAGYLSDILKHVETPMVRMEMTGETGACIIRPDGECGVDALFLLMPLRLNS